jgi:hypothetical protein
MTTRKRVAVGIAVAIAVVGVEFFFILHPLPLPVSVRVALAYMNFIPIAVALGPAGGSSPEPNLVVVGIVGFLLWFLVGFLLTLPFGRRHRQEPGSANERP